METTKNFQINQRVNFVGGPYADEPYIDQGGTVVEIDLGFALIEENGNKYCWPLSDEDFSDADYMALEADGYMMPECDDVVPA